MRQIYDISPTISPEIHVWPGDVGYAREVALSIDGGDNIELSWIRTTLHLGAHADAPSHYIARGRSIDAQPLDLYLGPCEVMRVRGLRGSRLQISDLPSLPQAPRLLLHTGTFPNPQCWNSDFASLSPELVEHLAQHGVRLIGIDTPSIDPQDDSDLWSHHAVARCDLAILEGLVLDEVPPGLYTLVALPLKLRGADASPVRAVLVRGMI